MSVNRFVLRGTELRYALTMYLFQHGTRSVADLITALDWQGFVIPGRRSKAVSDALRWECRRGRVCRVGRARYGPGEMPRSTEYRIHRRVLAMRDEALRMRAADDESFWNSLLGPSDAPPADGQAVGDCRH